MRDQLHYQERKEANLQPQRPFQTSVKKCSGSSAVRSGRRCFHAGLDTPAATHRPSGDLACS